MARLARSIRVGSAAIVVLVSASLATGATPAITMSVGPDETLTYPANMPSLPDEHTTVFPPAAGSGAASLRTG